MVHPQPAASCRTRPAQSAAKYRRIWDAQTGSPLLHYTRRQTEVLQKLLPQLPVRFGMQIGNPSVADVVPEMIAGGVDRLIVLPMYPQYSATTTASATDALFQALMKQRRVPALRIVPPYYEHPAYLDAMTAVIRDELTKLPAEPEHYVLSFHGIPIKYAQRGDPYATHVKRTTARTDRASGLAARRMDAVVSIAVRPGSLAQAVHRRRAARPRPPRHASACSSPCRASRPIAWRPSTRSAANRARYSATPAARNCIRCPCLNDHPQWIEAMRAIIVQEGQGWL